MTGDTKDEYRQHNAPGSQYENRRAFVFGYSLGSWCSLKVLTHRDTRKRLKLARRMKFEALPVVPEKNQGQAEI